MFEDLPVFFQVLVVILGGACVGSFLNVVVVRLPRGRSIVSPSSRTFPWRSPIPGHWNIPILSYLLSWGRCHQSGRIYSPRYLVLELLTPLIFLALYSVYGWSMTSLVYCIFLSVLLAGSFIDLELRIIPNSLTLGAWGVALLFAFFEAKGFPIDFWSSVIASLCAYLSFFVLSRGYYWLTGDEGLGGGDVKLMGFIGAVLGIEASIFAVLFASVSGALVGLILILYYGKGRRFPIPFGPFLSAGALASLVLGVNWWGFVFGL